jgi:hypothetical protein
VCSTHSSSHGRQDHASCPFLSAFSPTRSSVQMAKLQYRMPGSALCRSWNNKGSLNSPYPPRTRAMQDRSLHQGLAQFERTVAAEPSIPPAHRSHFLRWLTHFLDWCQDHSAAPDTETALQDWLTSMDSCEFPPWAPKPLQQAEHAVRLYWRTVQPPARPSSTTVPISDPRSALPAATPLSALPRASERNKLRPADPTSQPASIARPTPQIRPAQPTSPPPSTPPRARHTRRGKAGLISKPTAPAKL